MPARPTRSSSRSRSTEAINLVASSYGAANFKPGDEIVLSIMEHHSNIVPWHFHRERNGAVLKWAPISDTGEFLIDEFARLLTPRTKMVAITHMSNVLGTVVPIKEVIRLAHAKGIPVLVDGSQAAVHMPVDVRDLDADFYVFTGHKTYGPTRHRRALRQEEAPRRHAALHGRRRDDRERARRRHHLRQDAAQVRGRHAADRAGDRAWRRTQLHDAGRPREDRRARGRSRAPTRTRRLSALNYVKIHGRAPGKGAIVAFSIDGLHPHDISTIIDRSGIAVRAGHHCAQPLMERLGVTATCRASFAMYNTRAEVDALADALAKAHEFFG